MAFEFKQPQWLIKGQTVAYCYSDLEQETPEGENKLAKYRPTNFDTLPSWYDTFFIRTNENADGITFKAEAIWPGLPEPRYADVETYGSAFVNKWFALKPFMDLSDAVPPVYIILRNGDFGIDRIFCISDLQDQCPVPPIDPCASSSSEDESSSSSQSSQSNSSDPFLSSSSSGSSSSDSSSSGL